MQQNIREGQKDNGIVDSWWYKYLLKGVGTLGGLRKLLESAVMVNIPHFLDAFFPRVFACNFTLLAF